jgi:hypothetical protein
MVGFAPVRRLRRVERRDSSGPVGVTMEIEVLRAQ